MPESPSISFVISRLHVQLKVDLFQSRMVKIQPYQCAEKNQRLWKGISQAQAMHAQINLDTNNKAEAHHLLSTHFEQNGWVVRNVENDCSL